MPKFVYTFVIIFLFSSMVLARTIFWTSPEVSFSLFVFFFSLFLTLASLLSSVLSFALLPRARDVTNQRLVFRRIFRFAIIISLLVVAVGVLKVLGALTTLNFLLLFLLASVYGFFVYK